MKVSREFNELWAIRDEAKPLESVSTISGGSKLLLYLEVEAKLAIAGLVTLVNERNMKMRPQMVLVEALEEGLR